ncbi:MAG: S-layer homology domain-containing protein, partial [Oscillospiraceae bacterium]
SHMRYSLVSEFSNGRAKTENPSENPFGYCSYLMPDGNIAENIAWAPNGLSCTYTVYTNKGYQKEDDIYALTGLDFPLQFDVRNLIHDRKNEEIELKVTAKRVGDTFEITWPKPTNYDKLKAGKLFCQILSDKDDVVLEYELKSGELAEGKAVTPYTAENKLPEGKQCKIWAVLQDNVANPGYIAKGETVYYEPYGTPGEDIDLWSDKIDANDTLNLSGRETATFTLRATKSFNMNKGLKITVNADEAALEITSVAPSIGTFSGIARDGDQTVIELAPAGVTKEIKYRDQFVFAGDTIATLTVRGKNVASDGLMTLYLQDFFGKELVPPAGVEGSFAIAIFTKTTAVSSGGDYTPPKDDTQTLPDGTLVTTTTNPDGSIQIVYTRLDGVSSTVKTPVKGEAATASISLPPALAGTSVKVPIPVDVGGVTTVAVLVGADGKEQVIPGSFWKDGVLTVPLTGNANIIIRDNAKTFGDVAADYWAADAIAFVASRELFQGGGGGGFQPADDTTRSMLVTVLARYDGQNTAAGPRWDSVGTEWAKEQGISNGSDMEDAITREQLAVMLYRYAKAGKVEGDLTGFSDADGVSPWAREAMEWAVKTGIIGGANGALNPRDNASRAEVAAMLARFVTKV